LCVKCNSGAFVITADTLGHLVCVFRQFFYFCSLCNRVHSWTGKDNELFTCQQAREEPRRKHCVVCWRTSKHCPRGILCERMVAREEGEPGNQTGSFLPYANSDSDCVFPARAHADTHRSADKIHSSSSPPVASSSPSVVSQ
jgi:hypothetical protein